MCSSSNPSCPWFLKPQRLHWYRCPWSWPCYSYLSVSVSKRHQRGRDAAAVSVVQGSPFSFVDNFKILRSQVLVSRAGLSFLWWVGVLWWLRNDIFLSTPPSCKLDSVCCILNGTKCLQVGFYMGFGFLYKFTFELYNVPYEVGWKFCTAATYVLSWAWWTSHHPRCANNVHIVITPLVRPLQPWNSRNLF